MNQPTQTTCPRCERLIAPGSCPFCNRTIVSWFGAGMAAAMTPVFLAACYGLPPGEYKDSGDSGSGGAEDADGDGFSSDTDCNDVDNTIYPGATEICDDTVDNDCDALTDGDDPDCAG
jgi:hypothetical protein